jgi:hypothetical protein
MGWDYREVRREAIRQGWAVERRKKGEMFKSPDGSTQVKWHATPSDVNAVRQLVRRLRKGGFAWGG